MSEYLLEMRDVSKSFPGVKALDHVQLKLRPGKVHALMGENGEMTGTVLNDHVGQSHAAVDAAIAALNGEELQNYYWVDYVKVTK